MSVHSKIKAFTLIELSIILVIISLIVGGIVGGRSLIHSAEIRSLISDILSYETATNTFMQQYDAIPGDMRDAYDYWNNETTCTDNDINTTAGGCNGNGDHRLSADYEDTLFWHHLSLSKIIPQHFAIGYWVAGISSPKLSFNDASIRPYYGSVGGNRFRIASRPPGWLSGAVFTPKDARTIDKKIDDGIYNTGKFWGNNAQDPNGASYSDCFSGGAYNLSMTEVHCYGFYFAAGMN